MDVLLCVDHQGSQRRRSSWVILSGLVELELYSKRAKREFLPDVVRSGIRPDCVSESIGVEVVMIVGGIDA